MNPCPCTGTWSLRECVLVTQLFLTLCDPMDCSPPGSSIHGIPHDKNTGVGCHFLLQGIFPTQGLNPGLLHCRQTLYRLSHREDLLTTGQTGKSHESPFFIYMSYSLWPYYVSWYHLFIFRMSFLFEKFLCNWFYKWEPNSRQHTGSIVENIICNKTKDTKQRPTPFFLRGLIAAQLLSNYMKQDQGSVSDSGHQCHPSATFSLDLRADTQWTLAPSLHWRVWEFPYNWNQEGLYWNTSVPPCPSTGVWRDISNLYHFLFTSSFHSWWPSFHILFWCRQTLFYTKPFRVERQIHSHEAAEKQSWLWLHSCWRGWTWRVSANQELGPRWSCRPGWQDGNRYETPHGPVWSGPDNTVVSWACHCPLKTWRMSKLTVLRKCVPWYRWKPLKLL